MREYIGARYVPKFFENSATGDATWAQNTAYEALTIVVWNNGTYTSKKPVPATVGAPNLNSDYWVLTGSTNGAFDYLLEKVNANEEAIANLEDDVNSIFEHEEYFLYPTGDTADRADDIIAKLNSYGTCILAAGEYYIGKEVAMPYKTSIVGMGSNTVLVLNYNGNMIKMNTRCTISNVYLLGKPGDDLPYPNNGQKGLRVGILVDGDATDYETATYTHTYNIIDNVYIRNFDNSGIKCIRTGGSHAGCMVSNVYIQRCYDGVNIEYFSEMNIFTNVNIRECNDGCVLNGGNNSFNACQFMRNVRCVKMDNSDSSLLNSDHCLFNGCTFLHPGTNNDGYLLSIVGAKVGIIFSGCSFFHGIIDVSNSTGIEIVNSLIGLNGKTFRFENCIDCIISGNIISGTLPTWIFTDSSYSFVDNTHGGVIIDKVHDGAKSSINALGSLFLKYTGTLQGIHSREIGTVITEGYITIAVKLPKWMPNNTYDVNIQSCSIMNIGSVTISDIVVSQKSVGFVEFRVPYTSATTRHDSYEIDITFDIVVS